MRNQQAVERGPCDARRRAMRIVLARPKMTIAQPLPDPSRHRFVERIETDHVGHTAHAPRDLALRAKIMLLHVVLNIESVDEEARREIATGEKQGPHDAVGRTARILRPAHRRVAIFLASAARVVIQMLHDVRAFGLGEFAIVDSDFVEHPARRAVAARHPAPDVLMKIHENIKSVVAGHSA